MIRAIHSRGATQDHPLMRVALTAIAVGIIGLFLVLP